MAGGNIRVSGISLRVEGAEQFAQDLDKAQTAMKRNGAELKLLDATYSGAKSADYYGKRAEKLGQQLDEQRKKTETLRKAREAYAKTADADAKKLEQLDLRIIASQTDEAKLTAEIQQCNQAMSDQARQASGAAAQTDKLGDKAQQAGTAQKKLSEGTDKAGKSLRDAKKDAEAYGKKLDELAGKMTRTGGSMTRLLTMPIIGMGTAGLKFSLDFEDAMWETATMPGFVEGTLKEQQAQLDAMGDELLAISNRTNTAATDLAAGQYQALSSGVSKEDSAYWAERSAMAAKAGKSDVETVIDGASSVHNAWKEVAGGLDHILDAMITAQNVGKTTVGEIASQVGQVAGLGPQLKISFDEIMAATAALTANGLSTSSAITGLRGVMTAVIKPSSEAAKIAAELGLEFNAAAMQSKGLTGFLADVMAKTKGDSAILSKLFGEVEGLNAVMMLGTSSAELYADALRQIETASGTLDEAFELRISSKAERLSGSLNRVKNSGIELTEALYPAVEMAADLLDSVTGYMGELDEGQQKTLLGTLAITAALGPATTAVGKLITAGRTLASVMSGPWGWAAAGIAAIGGLTFALANMEHEAVRTQASLDFDIGIDASRTDEDMVRFQAKLQEWSSTHRLTVDGKIVPIVDADELSRDLDKAVDAAFSDRKLTVDEYVKIHTQIVDIENEANEGATSEDTAIRAVATELKDAVDDYNALLETVYRKGNTATDAEIAALDIALERLKTLRAELTGLQAATEDAETKEYRTAYEMARQGVGGMRAVEGATIYIIGQGLMVERENAARRRSLEDEQYAEITAATKSGASTADLQAMQSAHESAMATLDAEIAEDTAAIEKSYQDLITDMITARPDVAAWATEGGDLIEAAHRSTMGVGDDTGIYDLDFLRRYGTRDNIGASGAGDVYLPSQGIYARDFAGDWEALSRDERSNLVDELNAMYYDALDAWMMQPIPDGTKEVADVWAKMLESGLDPSALDVSKADGVLADYLRVAMLDQEGYRAIGTEAMEEIGSGFTEGSEGAEGAAEEAAAGISGALEPAGDQKGIGLSVGNTLRDGIIASIPGAVNAAASLASMINAQLAAISAGGTLIYPGTGLSLSAAARGGLWSSGNVTNDFSTSFNFPGATISGKTSAQVFADRINAYNRARQAAYGNA